MDFRAWGVPFPVPFPRDYRRGERRSEDPDLWGGGYPGPYNAAHLGMLPPFSPRVFDDGRRGAGSDWDSPALGSPKSSTATDKGAAPAASVGAGGCGGGKSKELKIKDHGSGGIWRDHAHIHTKRPSGISLDFALQQLHHQLTEAHKLYNGYVEQHNADISNAKSYADQSSLNRLWCDLVESKFKDPKQRHKFDSMAGKIAQGIQHAMEAVACGFRAETEEVQYNFERRARLVRKLGLSCDEIIRLAKKSARHRLACKDMVEEIELAKAMLDPYVSITGDGDSQEGYGNGNAGPETYNATDNEDSLQGKLRSQ